VYDTFMALCKIGFIRINVADAMNYLKLVVKIAYIELVRTICVYIFYLLHLAIGPGSISGITIFSWK
jgi:hypothetical protein